MSDKRTVIQLRVTEAEVALWKSVAERARMSLSEYMRQLARKDAGEGFDECSVCARRFTSLSSDKVAICRRCR